MSHAGSTASWSACQRSTSVAAWSGNTRSLTTHHATVRMRLVRAHFSIVLRLSAASGGIDCSVEVLYLVEL